jgi:hypothetical protein
VCGKIVTRDFRLSVKVSTVDQGEQVSISASRQKVHYKIRTCFFLINLLVYITYALQLLIYNYEIMYVESNIKIILKLHLLRGGTQEFL